jgi:hypothetical protein
MGPMGRTAVAIAKATQALLSRSAKVGGVKVRSRDRSSQEERKFASDDMAKFVFSQFQP